MPTKFAPVCSLPMMRSLRFHDCLGDYHLLLAHKILENPVGWGLFFREEGMRSKQPFIIMDNSLIELGEPLPPKDVAQAAKVVGAQCVVLPDKLGNYAATANLSLNAAEPMREALPERVGLMGVVQGRSRVEYLSCAEVLVEDCGVKYLSVPRITQEILGSRVFITEEISGLYPDVPIHLLGFSAFPLRLGCAGKLLTRHWNDPAPREEGWLERDLPLPDTGEVQQNLKLIRKWLGDW
jgi:hypothetical protein